MDNGQISTRSQPRDNTGLSFGKGPCAIILHLYLRAISTMAAANRLGLVKCGHRPPGSAKRDTFDVALRPLLLLLLKGLVPVRLPPLPLPLLLLP